MMIVILLLSLFTHLPTNSGQSPFLHNTSAIAEWTQTGPSDPDYEQLLDDMSQSEDMLDFYIFPSLTCERQTELNDELLARLLPSRIRYRWPVLLNKNSFRTTLAWVDNRVSAQSQGYPHEQIANSITSPFLVMLVFILLFLVMLILFFVFVIPFAALMLHLLVYLYALATSPSVRMYGRSRLIRMQKMKRRLEIARTPDRFRLEPSYNLPEFYRKDRDDEYPEELEEFDIHLKRLHGRVPSEINITDRFGNYMLQRGLEYDQLFNRFRLRRAELPKDEEEAGALKARLKDRLIQQARELLAQEQDYFTGIPKYRLKALELGIPYVEDEPRSIILTTLKKEIPPRKSKPSVLIPKAIQKEASRKVRQSSA